jgi:UDP-N-acetylmuramoyl-tripeptide--D-alanyl-D-alanine ligase
LVHPKDFNFRTEINQKPHVSEYEAFLFHKLYKMNNIETIYKIFKTHQHVTTDSRNIEPGSIFFALRGENFNGNKFAANAIEKGAICAVIDEKEYEITGKTVLVDDVLQTLKELANHHRKMLALRILAITGTNGKTTTKELIAAVLSKKYKVSFTQGNLNNHIGVPLTLLKMDETTEIGVVEMGANHPGEIDDLCKIAEPDFGIITNIGKAHLEGFGSFQGVINTKTELYRYLRTKNGTIFYNLDNPLLAELTQEIPNKISYGGENADFRAELITSPPYVHLKAWFPKGVLYLNTQLTGSYNFENIFAAACIGNYFKVDPHEIQNGLKEYTPKNNRSQLIVRNNLRITMDAYNANPTSMQASLNSFLQNNEGENHLILGDMLELGEYSEEEHLAILKLLNESGTVNVYTVGKQFGKFASGFGFKSFDNVDSLCETLQKNPILNGNVLIKGSRGIQLEKVLNFL